MSAFRKSERLQAAISGTSVRQVRDQGAFYELVAKSSTSKNQPWRLLLPKSTVVDK